MTQSVQGLDAEDWPQEASSSNRLVNSISLHDVSLGDQDAPLVILLHGFADFWWGWRRQVRELSSAGFLVVAPDQRGYNLSSKPIGLKAYDLDVLAADIAGLADAYGRTKFSVVGHDFGGLLAWWVATRYPDRVESLVAINAFHPSILTTYVRRHPSQLLRTIYMGIFQLPWLPEWMLRTNNFAVLQKLVRIGCRPNTFSSTEMQRYLQTWSVPGAMTSMINWYRALLRKPRERNVRVAMPTLLIWGVKDPYLQKGLAEYSLDLCDAGQILWMPEASHWPHLEEPGSVNTALVSFLRKAMQPSAGSSAA